MRSDNMDRFENADNYDEIREQKHLDIGEEKHREQHEQKSNNTVERTSSDSGRMRQQRHKRRRNNHSIIDISASVQPALVIDRNINNGRPTIENIAQHATLYQRINLFNQAAWIQLCS